MIIGIDGNEANIARRVGIGEYAFELLKEFSKMQKEGDKKDIKFKIYLKDQPLADMPESSKNWQYIVVKPRKFWTQIGLPFKLFREKEKLDVFFTPSHYAPRFSPIPTVISIMDVSYIHFPELFAKKDLYQLENWTKYSAKNATKIFTISQSSKDDIIKYYHVRPDEVVVTYPGIKSELGIMNNELGLKKLQEKYSISPNYVLFVGTIQPRKNIERLIEAFKILKQVQDDKNKDLELVIVGKKGWLFEPILAKPQALGIQASVKFLDFVADEDLASLYQHAICYCLPSLYEGFGLPVLEAMQHGCPVITSNISSLPEAGGDAAVYVDPMNVDDIAEKLAMLIKDTKLRKELIEKGHKQVKKFSWEKTAKETLEVLMSFRTK
jgi:glycosyltransferase involved in cell wall biosynthesis